MVRLVSAFLGLQLLVQTKETNPTIGSVSPSAPIFVFFLFISFPIWLWVMASLGRLTSPSQSILCMFSGQPESPALTAVDAILFSA